MNIRLGRAVVAALAAEVLGIVILAALVAIFGPPGFEAARPFAERLGQWVGPISGFVLCLLGGWWVAKPAAAPDRVRNGFAMGLIAALLDLATAAALGTGLAPLLLLSNAGRVVGGTLGGRIAATRAA